MAKNDLKTNKNQNNSKLQTIRLNKFIANSGICSRREADKFIQAGVVKVNGIPVTQLGLKIKCSDTVKFNDQEIKSEKPSYILLNQARGSDNKKNGLAGLIQKTIYPTDSLGRKECGLVLFTNDRELIQKEKSKFKAIYHIILNKKMQEDDLERIKKHELFKRKTYHKNSISYINNNKKNEIGVELNLKDFKSLKSIIKKLDYTIKVTDRVTLANLTKKDLPRKAYRNLIINEINMLKRL